MVRSSSSRLPVLLPAGLYDSQEVRGTQCGIIKFGSRFDMYLPLDADIKVKVGEEIKAAETVVAVLK